MMTQPRWTSALACGNPDDHTEERAQVGRQTNPYLRGSIYIFTEKKEKKSDDQDLSTDEQHAHWNSYPQGPVACRFAFRSLDPALGSRAQEWEGLYHPGHTG